MGRSHQKLYRSDIPLKRLHNVTHWVSSFLCLKGVLENQDTHWVPSFLSLKVCLALFRLSARTVQSRHPLGAWDVTAYTSNPIISLNCDTRSMNMIVRKYFPAFQSKFSILPSTNVNMTHSCLLGRFFCWWHRTFCHFQNFHTKLVKSRSCHRIVLVSITG